MLPDLVYGDTRAVDVFIGGTSHVVRRGTQILTSCREESDEIPNHSDTHQRRARSGMRNDIA